MVGVVLEKISAAAKMVAQGNVGGLRQYVVQHHNGCLIVPDQIDRGLNWIEGWCWGTSVNDGDH